MLAGAAGAVGAAAGRELLPVLKMAAPAGGAHGSEAARRSGGMAAAAEEPSRGYWDEEEEAVSATAEARAAVARVAARLCAGKGLATRRACGGSWRDRAPGRAERRAAGLSPTGHTEVQGGRREVTLSNGARFLLLKAGPSFHKGGIVALGRFGFSR